MKPQEVITMTCFSFDRLLQRLCSNSLAPQTFETVCSYVGEESALDLFDHFFLQLLLNATSLCIVTVCMAIYDIWPVFHF